MIDAKGLLHIADRNNARIQVFDIDGRFVRESKHPGTPCGLFLRRTGFYLAHGHTGLVKQLDLDGNVLGETGAARARPWAATARRTTSRSAHAARSMSPTR